MDAVLDPRQPVLKKVAEKKSARPSRTTQSDDRKKSVASKLGVIARQLWMNFGQRVEKLGVTRAKWTLIAAVAREPGATQRTIATLLQVTEATAGRLIDRLCTDGYLERRENPGDRRSYRIYLTPAAQPVLERLGDVASVHLNEAFVGLSDKDLAKLELLLDAISRNIGPSRKLAGENTSKKACRWRKVWPDLAFNESQVRSEPFHASGCRRGRD